MKRNHSTFLIMALTVTLFVASVYGYMYYMINVAREKTVKAQSLINSSKAVKERENSFLNTYEKTVSKWSKIQGFFVESNKVVNFIESIELLSQQSGGKVTISSIEADNLENASAGKEGTIRMKITAQGSWESVMRALKLAELLPYKISVNNVQASSFNSDQNNDDKSKVAPKSVWNLSFDLQVAMLAATTTSVNIK